MANRNNFISNLLFCSIKYVSSVEYMAVKALQHYLIILKKFKICNLVT